MSKFGWSLPPGCTTLPGEELDAQQAEAMVERLYETVAPLRPEAPTPLYEQLEDEVVTALEKIITEVYAEGRTDALADEAMAREAEEETSRGRS